eukprot:5770359-Prymnesium_polylepis.1
MALALGKGRGANFPLCQLAPSLGRPHCRQSQSSGFIREGFLRSRCAWEEVADGAATRSPLPRTAGMRMLGLTAAVLCGAAPPPVRPLEPPQAPEPLPPEPPMLPPEPVLSLSSASVTSPPRSPVQLLLPGQPPSSLYFYCAMRGDNHYVSICHKPSGEFPCTSVLCCDTALDRHQGSRWNESTTRSHIRASMQSELRQHQGEVYGRCLASSLAMGECVAANANPITNPNCPSTLPLAPILPAPGPPFSPPSRSALRILMLGNSFTARPASSYSLPSALKAAATRANITLDVEYSAPATWRLCQHAVCQDSICRNPDTAIGNSFDAVVLQPQSEELFWALQGGHFCGNLSAPAVCDDPNRNDCGLCHGSTARCASHLLNLTMTSGARVYIASTWAYSDEYLDSDEAVQRLAGSWTHGTMQSELFRGAQELQAYLAGSTPGSGAEIVPYGAAVLECHARFPATLKALYAADGWHFNSLGAELNAITLLGTLTNLTVAQILESQVSDFRSAQLAVCAASAVSGTTVQLPTVWAHPSLPPPPHKSRPFFYCSMGRSSHFVGVCQD